ncbi:MAG: hypothetical protein U0670_06665 [Anaerolineae bacterium]
MPTRIRFGPGWPRFLLLMLIIYLVPVFIFAREDHDAVPTLPAPTHLPNQSITYNGAEGVIFRAENARGHVPDLPDSVGWWTPVLETDIPPFEAGLQAALTEQLGDRYDEAIIYDLPSYIRQYVGIEIDGERYLWVNFICSMFDILPDYWNQIIIGGQDNACYFHVRYAVGSGVYTDLITAH